MAYAIAQYGSASGSFPARAAVPNPCALHFETDPMWELLHVFLSTIFGIYSSNEKGLTVEHAL